LSRRSPRADEGSSQVTLSEVADAMVLVAMALRGGRGFVEALADVARGSPPRVADQLTQVVAAIGWGLPQDQWWSLASPAWGGLAQASRLADRAGVPPAGLVLAAAADLRARAAGELDERVGALGVRLVLPLGLAFLPGFLLTTVVPVILTVAASVLPGS
jgi:pilus assembly protein TadC